MNTRVETADYLGHLERTIAAAGRRVAMADPIDLVLLVNLRSHLDAATAEAVAGLRAAGFTWGSIGGALGVTAQAANLRWGGANPSNAAAYRRAANERLRAAGIEPDNIAHELGGYDDEGGAL